MRTEAPSPPGVLRIELRRPPLASDEPLRSALVVASVFLLTVAAAVQLAPGSPLVVHLGIVGSLFLVVGAFRLLLRLRPPRSIDVGPAYLRLPRFTLSPWRIEVPIDAVFDARATPEGVTLGVTGRMPFRYRVSRFERGADDTTSLVEAVRAAVLSRSHGVERLHAFDLRARLAANMSASAWATFVCVGLTLAVYLAQLAGGASALDPARLVQFGANAPILIARGELYRLVTANLLHASVGHLYLNALLLLVLGSRLEGLIGTARMWIVLVAAAIGGTLVANLGAAAEISIGASTAVAGVVGGLTYLNLARRDELPAGIRAPLWLFAVLGAAQVLFEVSAPNVAHGAHVGGLATGWLATAAVVGRSPLAELREEEGRSLRVGFGVALACALAGVVWGAVRVVVPNRESIAVVGERLLAYDDASPVIVNNFAWEWGDDPDTPRPRIAQARTSMERVVRRNPTNHAFWDTYALVSWRDEQLDDAIIAQWNAKVLFDNPLYGRRLADYEAERKQRSGPVYLGPGSRFEPRFTVEAPRPGELGERVIELQLPGPLPNGGVIHALLYREGRLYGHLELWLGPTERTEHRLSDETSAMQLDPSIEFRTALVDTRPKGVAPGTWSFQIWAFP